MVSRQSRIEMSVGGVKKITLWKQAIIEGEEVWEECPNLPKPFLQTYLSRGFVESPPESKPESKPETKVEEKVETFSEAIASGKLDNVAPVSTETRVNKKLGRPRKKV
jgi:hypothetical protein